VGVQEGAGMEPGSLPAILTNFLLLGVKVAYGAYILVIRPQVSLPSPLVHLWIHPTANHSKDDVHSHG
jgi:hypothetical protein